MQSLLIDDASVLIDSKSPIIVCVEAYLDTNYDTLIFDDKSELNKTKSSIDAISMHKCFQCISMKEDFEKVF